MLPRSIDTRTFGTRGSTSDHDLGALSLSELKKMHKDIAKAISTFKDRRKVEARAKVEAVAEKWAIPLPNWSALTGRLPVRLGSRTP